MNLFSTVLCAALLLGTVAAFSQANEDEIVTAQKKYPLAALAGVDSHAIDKAPEGAVNQGKFDDKTWKFGHVSDPLPGAKLWNPVKIKMLRGGKVTGGTVFSATDPETYCAMANAGYDFIWTEHQQNARDWKTTQRMWVGCPHAKAVPGVRVAWFVLENQRLWDQSRRREFPGGRVAALASATAILERRERDGTCH